MIHDLFSWLIQTVGSWGYIGIFLLTVLESSLIPIPSELVLLPAGYFASPSQGKLNLWLVILIATLGCIGGALINYYLAYYFGRPLMLKLCRWVGVSEHHVEKAETFFLNNGEIGTFLGRLLPGVRHLISIPAGLTGMSPWKMSFYTFLGGGLWTMILVFIGYFVGENIEQAHHVIQNVVIYVCVMTVVLGVAYWYYRKFTTFVIHTLPVETFGSFHKSGKFSHGVLLLSTHSMLPSEFVRCEEAGQIKALYKVVDILQRKEINDMKKTIAFRKKVDKVDPVLQKEMDMIYELDTEETINIILLVKAQRIPFLYRLKA